MAKTDADSWVAANKVKIETAENNVFATKGRYHQCLDSHSVVPNEATKPDKQAAKTTDSIEGWSNLTGAILDPLVPIAACVSAYVYNIQGVRGWVLGVKAREGGINYIKTYGYGPEAAERTRDWTVLTDEVPAQLPAPIARKAKR